MAGRTRRRAHKSAKLTKKFTYKMQASLLLVFCIVLLCFGILLIRLVKINTDSDGKYERRVLSQQTYVSTAIPYKRGDILDRNNTKLATSEKVYNMILDPVTMLEKEDYREPTIAALSECFGITAQEVNTILMEKANSRYVIMKEYKGLGYDEVTLFETKKKENKNIKGVWFEEEYVRRYPLSNVASNIIGFTQKGDANIGTWGIEEYYNEELSGNNGREYGYFDSELNLERNVKPAVNGYNIVSTIDANVQAIVEKHVEQYLNETGAANMAVLLMNPQNGEIYSMVSNYSFDLNNPRDLTAFYTEEELKAMTDVEQSAALSKLWRNYCISDAYEPGSTFKPFTVAAALDEAIATPKSTYVCNRRAVVAGKTIKCNATHNVITLEESLMYSCNVAMMNIVEIMGRTTFSEYLLLFGLGQKTGIDLPGEAAGLVYSEDKLNPVELATSSFGQSNTVTMIQMAAGFSSLINGGNYYKPHIVKQIENDSGAVVEEMEPVLVKETVSRDTSDKIRKYLYSTVETGTAAPAGVEGYEIGGKTGTAEKHPRGQGNYLVSFLGFTPIKEPKVVVYVVIDEPNEEEQDHSTYATEFASKVMAEVLPFLGVYPSEEMDTDAKKTDEQADSVEGAGDERATSDNENLNEIEQTAENSVEQSTTEDGEDAEESSETENESESTENGEQQNE